MSDQEVTKEEITHMVVTVNTFSKMVKNTDSYSKSTDNIQLAMNCAQKVENIYSALKNEHLHFLFIQCVCETLRLEDKAYNISEMQHACDVVLQAILTSDNVPLSCVSCCLNKYIELCGNHRLKNLLSAIIVHSEASRVLQDIIGSTETDSQTSVIFQANLLLKILTANGNETLRSNTVFNWLNSQEKYRVHVVFQAILEAGLNHDISIALIKGLLSVLDDRREAAILYWSTITSSSICIFVLKQSRSLVYASLDFLSKSAENFKQNSEFEWVSEEDGPCQEITFEMIVTYVNFLKSADDTFKSIVDTFIRDRCCLPGCLFWEDIIERF